MTDKYEAYRLLGLKATVKPNMEDLHRYVMRWYSRTFHTPLHIVQSQIPLDDVWQTYFEEKFAGLDHEELQEEVKHALETPAQRLARLKNATAMEAADQDFLEMARLANTNIQPENPVQDIPVPVPPPGPEAKIIEPDIDIQFVSPDDFEALISKGGFANQTK